MYRPRCEYCGRFISNKDLDSHYKGDTTIIDSRMIYTNYPEPEPWGNIWWHIKCRVQKVTKAYK